MKFEVPVSEFLYKNFNGVDSVIVTAITFYEEIKAELVLKIKCPIISLEDILYGI